MGRSMLLKVPLLLLLSCLSVSCGIGFHSEDRAADARSWLTIDRGQPEDEEESFGIESELEEPEKDGKSSEADGKDGAWGKLKENLRLNLDLISRVETTRRRGKAATLSAIGLDLHKVFSDDEGNIGTLLLQPFIVRRDNALPLPRHVERDDDWEVEFHDFYFNLTRWGKGQSNFKVGHFDLPFGLEPQQDTHFTLRQLIPFQNLGSKKDWGVSVNGSLTKLDYEVSLTTGSGFELHTSTESWALTGRIGTPAEQNLVVGLSGFVGEVLPAMGGMQRMRGRNVFRRSRVGLDSTWIIGQLTLDGEVSYGRDFRDNKLNALGEVRWSLPGSTLTTYVQGVYLGGERSMRMRMQMTGPMGMMMTRVTTRRLGWDEQVLVRGGLRWELVKDVSVGAQVSYDLATVSGRRPDAKFSLQLNIRF